MVLVGHAQALPDVVQVLPQHGLAAEEELEIVPPVRRNSSAPTTRQDSKACPVASHNRPNSSSTGRAFQRKSSGLPPQLIPSQADRAREKMLNTTPTATSSTKVTRAERRGMGFHRFLFSISIGGSLLACRLGPNRQRILLQHGALPYGVTGQGAAMSSCVWDGRWGCYSWLR